MSIRCVITAFIIIFETAFLVSVSLPTTGGEGSPRFTFTTQEVDFTDGSTLLKGTLFRPDTNETAPGVVILGGSERSARNSYKKNIARDFVVNGMAALIYDSPGTGSSMGNAFLQTKDDRVQEALAAMRFLCIQPGISSDEVGIWGLSEGANIALLAAAKDTAVAFSIPVSSALGVSPLEISRFRIEMTGHKQGLTQDDIQKALVLEEILYELLARVEMAEWRLIMKKVQRWKDEPWDELIDSVSRSRQAQSQEEKQNIQKTLNRAMKAWKNKTWFRLAVVDIKRFEQVINMEVNRFFNFLQNSPWAKGDWNSHLQAKGVLAKLQCPVLAIWGEKDNYLPPHRSAATLKHLLSKSTHDLTLKIIPEASHILTFPGIDDLGKDYSLFMIDWLKARFRLPQTKNNRKHGREKS